MNTIDHILSAAYEVIAAELHYTSARAWSGAALETAWAISLPHCVRQLDRGGNSASVRNLKGTSLGIVTLPTSLDVQSFDRDIFAGAASDFTFFLYRRGGEEPWNDRGSAQRYAARLRHFRASLRSPIKAETIT